MIQRIQTLFVAIALIVTGLTAVFPLAEIVAEDTLYQFNVDGVENIKTGAVLTNGWPLTVLLSVICMISVVVILSFKKRVRQMRLLTFNILLLVGFLGVGWYFFNTSLGMLNDPLYTINVPASFPIVAIILNYLAIRAIGKDEALVRSVDRIR